MAAIDVGTRPRWVLRSRGEHRSFGQTGTNVGDRDALPSISHLDLDKLKSDKNDLSRFSMVNGLSISTGPLTSPTASMYSGPPPPYTGAPSTAGSTSGLSGYISPPESTTRHSARDEKDSPGLRKSLPSIHEALNDKSLSFPGGPLPASSQNQTLPAPSTAIAQPFSDGPKGPVNPFSQPAPGAPVLRDVFSGTQKNASTPVEAQTSKPAFPPVSASDPRQSVSQHFGYPGSPRSHPISNFRSSSLTNSSFTNHNEPPPARSPQAYEPPRPPFSFPQYNHSGSASFPPAQEAFQFSAGTKPDEQRGPYQRSGGDVQYSDTVKRHLDVFDAELGLNEVCLSFPWLTEESSLTLFTLTDQRSFCPYSGFCSNLGSALPSRQPLGLLS